MPEWISCTYIQYIYIFKVEVVTSTYLFLYRWIYSQIPRHNTDCLVPWYNHVSMARHHRTVSSVQPEHIDVFLNSQPSNCHPLRSVYNSLKMLFPEPKKIVVCNRRLHSNVGHTEFEWVSTPAAITNFSGLWMRVSAKTSASLFISV